MCDTFAVGPSCTAGKVSIFAKNSDREPDETQLVLSMPGKEYPANELLQCTYIAIPQARSTRAAVICRPFWMWGAEMGVNEKGVAIGNEAVFTRIRPEKTPGLIGMDLLRLALERSDTAEDAVEVITSLLQRYGQAGPCGYRDKKFTYMNSFIVMDSRTILVLETLGRDYAVKRPGASAVISNALTLEDDWDQSSLPQGTRVRSFSDPLITFFSGSAHRRRRNMEQIDRIRGGFTVAHAFSMLRSHFSDTPLTGFNRDVCYHASDPLISMSQTTGSLVTELHPDGRLRIFVTAGSAPCLTPFKPFLPSAPYEDAGRGGERFAADSFWWRHEAMHVNALFRPHAYRASITGRITAMERAWEKAFPAHEWDAAQSPLVAASHAAFLQSDLADRMYLEEMRGMGRLGFSMERFFWKRVARRTGLDLL
jgi:dipeptidase